MSRWMVMVWCGVTVPRRVAPVTSCTISEAREFRTRVNVRTSACERPDRRPRQLRMSIVSEIVR